MSRVLIASALAAAIVVPALAQNPQQVQTPPAAPPQAQGQGGGRGAQTPELIKAARDREVEGQKQTDAAWRKASEGVMKMEKITYKSTAKDGMAIPAFVFTPLKPRGDKGHGYDPIFQPLGKTETFAEMDQDEKNRISHRADAFGQLVKAVF